MAKLKSPIFSEKIAFEKWCKLLNNWLRTIPTNTQDDEIVGAVIMGLSNSQTREGALDLVLDLDDSKLYPEKQFAEMSPLEEQTEDRDKKPEVKSEGTLKNRKVPGLEMIITNLKKKFGMNEDEKVFRHYEEFENIKRDSSNSMSEYIMKFESSLRKLTDAGVVINDTILAYRLLRGAALGDDEKIVRTSVVDMTLEEMKKTLLKASDVIICTSSRSKSATPKIRLKEEPIEVLYGQHRHQDDNNKDPEDEDYYQEADVYDYDEEDIDNQEIYFYKHRGRGQRYNTPFRGRYIPKNRERGQYSDNRQIRSNYQPRIPRTNTTDKQSGQTTGCHICKCIMHWARECPYKNQISSPQRNQEDKSEMILKVDSVMIDDDEQLIYLANETKNLALIDSGASKTVCGRKWFEIFENSINHNERSKIREESSCNHFKFGDSKPVKSDTVKVIPVNLCGKNVQIKASIVENDVPLLISRHTLTEAKANLNFEHGILEIQGKPQKLITTSSGHLAIPVAKTVNDLKKGAEMLFMECEAKDTEVKKIATKLHRYFAHAHKDRLIKFVNKTDHHQKEEICKELNNLNCDLCKKHGRETPKPKTCLPMADRFNQTVAMDLKFLENSEIILHCIDLLTRYSVAVIIRSKEKEVIVENFFKSWIAIFGRPEQTLCDNGKEFCNEAFLEMCRHMDIKMKTTAAFSPFSNGVVERHNGLLAEMVYKIKEDANCSTDIALCWAVNAKNNMSNAYGFSPQQLVFGYTSAPPGLDDTKIKLSQLDNETSSKIVADNINALHESRQAFLMAQNSDRIKRALKDRVYTSYETKYFPGDSVYYKTNGKTWKGPGIVIGQYQKLVLVKTGGLFVRVHPSRIKLSEKADKEINQDRQLINDDIGITNKNQDEETKSNDSDSDSESDSESCREEQVIDRNMTSRSELHDSNSTEEVHTEDIDSDNSREQIVKWTKITSDPSKKRIVLNQGDDIRFKTSDNEDFKEATVIGNAGRVTGINKDRYNIMSPGGTKSSVFTDRVTELQRKDIDIDSVNYQVICLENEEGIYFSKPPDSDTLKKLREAKEQEIENFKKFQVYREISIGKCQYPEDIISSRWIIQEKTDGRVKARLCARGFEECDSVQSTDAPTADKSSIRIFLTLICMLGWKSGSLDIKSAFLQSHELKRSVYLLPPKDIRKDGVVWEIKKPIYGLKDSAMNWYRTLKSDLIDLGCVQSILDPTVFCFYHEEKLLGMFICHVDDFLFSLGDQNFQRLVINKLKEKYEISSESYGTFDYVGLNLQQDTDGIIISQKSFAEKILPIIIPRSNRPDDDILSANEKKKYQALLGKINWLAHQSRPDLAHQAYTYSLCAQNPNIANLKGLNKVISSVQNGPQILKFSMIQSSSLQIVCFSDASLANMEPKKTNSGEGFLTFLSDNTGNCALVNWRSKKIKRVVHSTIASECLSLVDAIGDACYVRNVVEEILYRNPRKRGIPISMYVDSKQLFRAISSTHMVNEKLLRLNIAEVKQIVENKEELLSVHWIPTQLMLSDSLTKIGASSEKLAQVMECGKLDLQELYSARACLND